MDMYARISVRGGETPADDWSGLKKSPFDFKRVDAAAILLYNRERQTVVLTRQFRYPAYVNGHHGMLLEACAGVLSAGDPESRVRQEAEARTGCRVRAVELAFTAFMSPGSTTERLFCYLGAYNGGGPAADDEQIGAVELPFAEALAMIARGEIVDGKTIMLLQHLQLSGRMAERARAVGAAD